MQSGGQKNLMDRSGITSETERKVNLSAKISVTLDRVRKVFCRGRLQPRWCSSLQWFLSQNQRRKTHDVPNVSLWTMSFCMLIFLLTWYFFF